MKARMIVLAVVLVNIFLSQSASAFLSDMDKRKAEKLILEEKYNIPCSYDDCGNGVDQDLMTKYQKETGDAYSDPDAKGTIDALYEKIRSDYSPRTAVNEDLIKEIIRIKYELNLRGKRIPNCGVSSQVSFADRSVISKLDLEKYFMVQDSATEPEIPLVDKFGAISFPKKIGNLEIIPFCKKPIARETSYQAGQLIITSDHSSKEALALSNAFWISVIEEALQRLDYLAKETKVKEATIILDVYDGSNVLSVSDFSASGSYSGKSIGALLAVVGGYYQKSSGNISAVGSEKSYLRRELRPNVKLILYK